ncbi:unnamed protein product, partial [Prunus brigantina]
MIFVNELLKKMIVLNLHLMASLSLPKHHFPFVLPTQTPRHYPSSQSLPIVLVHHILNFMASSSPIP